MFADVGSGLDDPVTVGLHAAQRSPQIPADIQEDNHSVRTRFHTKTANQGTSHPTLVERKECLLTVGMVMTLHLGLICDG